MTYSSGGLIQSTDYNGFVSTTTGANINATWNTAYGQTALATVSNVATVSATQWATLNTTISSMASHQGTTITSRTNPTAGNIISVLANVNADISSCYTNRLNAATSGSQYTAWTGTASKTTGTGAGQAAWSITFTDTVTFANAAAATSFFNAGGYFNIQFSKTSTGLDADDSWNSFVGAVVADSVTFTADANLKTIGGISYNGTNITGGTGTPTTLATGTGFNQLTTAPTTIYKQFDTSYAVYTSNYIQVTAAVNANSNPTVLTFTTTWYDNGDTNVGANAEISGGTSTTGITFGTAPATVVTYFPPETTYLTNSWDTPTVVSAVA